MDDHRGAAAGDSGTDFFTPPGPVNDLLAAVLAGEAGKLVDGLDAPGLPRELAYGGGVSPIALVRRLAGDLQPRTRPAGVPPDVHSPRA